MSERGKPSSARGGNSNRGGYNKDSNRGKSSGRGNHNQKPKNDQGEKRTRSNSIIDLSKYIDKRVHVKFSAGREVTGILKGFDPLLNLVLDDTVEMLKDPEDPSILSNATRNLGLLVCRGPLVIMISPAEGYTEIDNPFLQANEEANEIK